MDNHDIACVEKSTAEASGRKEWYVSQGAYECLGGAKQAASQEPGDADDDTAES
jgi:hypothetical protein